MNIEEVSASSNLALEDEEVGNGIFSRQKKLPMLTRIRVSLISPKPNWFYQFLTTCAPLMYT
jgi:hypothetical protein